MREVDRSASLRWHGRLPPTWCNHSMRSFVPHKVDLSHVKASCVGFKLVKVHPGLTHGGHATFARAPSGQNLNYTPLVKLKASRPSKVVTATAPRVFLRGRCIELGSLLIPT